MDTFATFFKSKPAFISACCIVVILFSAIMASEIAPYDPLKIDLDNIKRPPDHHHLLGTDKIGRDVLSRIIYGARISLFIGISATILSLSIGLCVGLIAGYCGGKIDNMLILIIDLFLAFPSLLLAIGISVLFPSGIVSVLVALCLTGWATFARLFRSVVLSLRESVFVDAARATGCSPARVLFVHILPHCLPLATVAASLKIGGFILSESALSFLGLGVQPPVPTWGAMVSLNRSYLPSAPWMVLFPGLAIAVTVILFNTLGNTIRDMFDPSLKI